MYELLCISALPLFFTFYADAVVTLHKNKKIAILVGSPIPILNLTQTLYLMLIQTQNLTV